MCKVLKSHSGSFRIPPHADARLLEMQMIYKVTLVSKCWFQFFLPLGCNWTPRLKIHKGICFISFFFSFTVTGASATFTPTAASMTKRDWLASVSTTPRGLTVAAVRGIIRPELGAQDPISPSPRAQQISVSTHRHTHTYTHIPIPLTGKNNTGSVFVDNKAHMSFYSDHKPSLLLLSYLSQCAHGVSPEAITLLPV